MKKNDLKPCPFCAGKATMLIVPGEKSKWLVKCQNGCCNQMPHDSEEKAAEVWNRRTEVNNQSQEVSNQSQEVNSPNDCISRQALISTILGMTTFGNVHELNKFVHKCHLDGEHMGGLRDAVLAIVNAPSVQPEWNEILVICDNCGHAIHVNRKER